MFRIPLAVINASSLVGPEELNAATAALQVQVSRDFAPAWNVDAALSVVPAGETAAPGTWWIVLLDNSDLGSALGYHDLTSEGLPMAKVFVETAKRTGQEWTVLFSHEVLEMLGDPYVNLTAVAPTPYGYFLYAYENCDACQSDRFGYEIDGHLVSDFCLPAWFDATKYGTSARFDFSGQMKTPFQLLSGGYAMCQPLAYPTGWQLVMGPNSPLTYTARPRVGSRRERRRTELTNWQRSEAATPASSPSQSTDI